MADQLGAYLRDQLSGELHRRIFEPLRDPDYFRQFRLDPELDSDEVVGSAAGQGRDHGQQDGDLDSHGPREVARDLLIQHV